MIPVNNFIPDLISWLLLLLQESSPLRLTGLVAGLLLVWNVLAVAYNLFFHPLRKYPGPFVARCSGLWGFWLNLHGRRAERIVEAHKKYGKFKVGGP